MAVRRLFTRQGWMLLAAAVALFVAGGIVRAPVLGYFALLFLLLLAGGLLSVYLVDARGEVSRTISTDLLTVGETSDVHVHLRPRARLLRYARWRDTLPSAVSGVAEGSVSPPGAALDTRASIPLEYSVRGVRRGIWTLGPLVLRTGDPFGLAERRQNVGETRSITVVPQLIPVPELVALHGGAGGTAHTVSSRLGQGADNLAPRRYVPGDSMRRIHWRATAHRGDLMVRQEEEEDSPDALVILDLNPARWSRDAAEVDPLFEAAVSMCASTALYLATAGYTVIVSDHAGETLAALQGSEEERDELLVALAGVFPHGEETAPHLDASPQGPLVVITGRVEAAGAGLPKRPAAATAILLAADPEPGALEALRGRGWVAERLDEGGADA